MRRAGGEPALPPGAGMDERMLVRIKYCGGCKAEYDRPELARTLLAELAGHLERPVGLAAPDQAADLGLVLCGCPACCADRPELLVGADHWHVIGPELFDYHSVAFGALAARIAAKLRQREGN